MAWQGTKTDWDSNDNFRAPDWERITNNVAYLANAVSITPPTFVVAVNRQTVLTSADRNMVTDTLELIYKTIGASFNRGYVAPRVDYGSCWNSRDLNIIESLTLGLYKQITGATSGNVDYFSDEIFCGDTISIGLL